MSKNLGTSWERPFSSPREALNAMVNYLGKKRFKLLARASKGEIYSEEQLAIFCAISGVEGYPVEALRSRYKDGDKEADRNLKPFYFTFGFGHWMEYPAFTEFSLYNYYTCIYAADEYSARRIMDNKRGRKWAYSYDEDLKAGAIDRYDCKFIQWSKVTTQPGPTK